MIGVTVDMVPASVSSPGNEPVELFYGPRVQLPSGLVLGSRDAAGVSWHVHTLDGWHRTGTTGKTTQRSYRHGAWVDRAFYPARIITVTGELFAPNAGSLETRWSATTRAADRFLASIPLDDPEPFVVTLGGVPRVVYARQDGEPWVDVQAPGDWAKFSLQLVAPDPRRLSQAERQVTTGLPQTTGGLTVPFTVPFTIDAVRTAGSVRVSNAGDTNAPATLRIDGPVVDPVVRHVETGDRLRFDITLDSAQWLDIDLDTRAVLLNGQASRRGRMRGQWFDIEPGINTLAFTAAYFNPDARLTVSWRDAYR